MHERWRISWREGRIGFHQDAVHQDLVSHERRFLGGGARRVLVPLCGKTRDLDWLVARGHEVVGVEFVEQAVRELFAESGRTPTRDTVGGAPRWRDGALTIIQGDYFTLADNPVLGDFDRVWDRAALVAIDPERRDDYVDVTRRLLRPGGAMLLNVFDYDQDKMSGPPWSVPEREVFARYGELGVERVASYDATERGGFKNHDYWRVNTFLIGEGGASA